jgi:hypothetical protein
MRYRRADVTGGTYFFTVNLAERRRTLLVDYVDVLREVVREVKENRVGHHWPGLGDRGFTAGCRRIRRTSNRIAWGDRNPDKFQPITF